MIIDFFIFESLVVWNFDWLTDPLLFVVGMDNIDYSRFPDKEYQMDWLRIYLECYNERRGCARKEPAQHDLDVLYIQVNKFVLVCVLVSASLIHLSGDDLETF